MRRTLGRLSHWAFDRPLDIIVTHFENRLFELAMASVMLAAAVMLTFSPGSAEAGGLRYLSRAFSGATLTVVFYLAGSIRIVALALNGHWKPYGAWVRASGAVVGAFAWAFICAALVEYAHREGVIPFSVGTYSVLAFFEAISMYRALAGSRSDGQGVRVGHRDHRNVEARSGAVHRGDAYRIIGGGGASAQGPAI